MSHLGDELLSAHADGAAGAEAALAESHLSECSDCRKRLAELKAVSRLVADLPKKELPVGFMARLERRRREAEAPATRLLPGLSPLRLAAFAATGLLVGLVFFREVRYRFAPQMLGAAGGAEEFASEFKAGRADDAGVDPASAASGRRREAAGAELDESALEQARLAAVSRGAWGGLAERGAAAPQPSPAGAVRGAKLKGGSPLDAERSSSNEEIHGFLEKERRRMGIQEIVPPSSPAPADAIPDRPLSKDEAMDVMRSMTRQLTRINREAADKRSPTVALEGGRTPAILGSREESKPLAEQAGDAGMNPASAASRRRQEAAGGLSMLRGAQGLRVDQPAGFGFDAAPSNAARPAAAKSPPAKTLAPRGSWSGATGGLGQPGGAVLTSAEDWADLWKRSGRTEALPSVDFSKEMVVAVFGAAEPSAARSIEIVSLSEEGGSLVIRYRAKAESGPGPSAPYHAVVAPKSALPFSFVQVP